MPAYRSLWILGLLIFVTASPTCASGAVLVTYQSSSTTLTDGDGEPSGDPVSLVVDASLTSGPSRDERTFTGPGRRTFSAVFDGTLSTSQITESLLQRAFWQMPPADLEIAVQVSLYDDGSFDVSTDFVRQSSITLTTTLGDDLTTRYMQHLATNFGGSAPAPLFVSTNALTLELLETLVDLSDWTSHYYFEELVNETAGGSLMDDSLQFVEDDTGAVTVRVSTDSPPLRVPLPGSFALVILGLGILTAHQRAPPRGDGSANPAAWQDKTVRPAFGSHVIYEPPRAHAFH